MSAAGRLFVAVELPPAVRHDLSDWTRRTVAQRDDLRLVPTDALHLTLVFLGERPLTDVPGISAALEACADEPVPLRLGGVLWLAPRHPHVLTVALDDPAGALDALHRRMEAALVERVDDYEPERRVFRPHVTVARVRRGVRVRPARLDAPAPARFAATALVLHRSRLRGGPQYEVLARAPLPVPG